MPGTGSKDQIYISITSQNDTESTTNKRCTIPILQKVSGGELMVCGPSLPLPTVAGTVAFSPISFLFEKVCFTSGLGVGRWLMLNLISSVSSPGH